MAFHDHARVLGAPHFLARRISARINELNEIYEQIHREYDSIHVDLREEPMVYRREFWAVDRLHPSEIGHRVLALRFAEALEARGLPLDYPGLGCNGDTPSRLEELGWLVSAGLPWLARRLRDWAPTLAGKARDQVGNRCRALGLRVPAIEHGAV